MGWKPPTSDFAVHPRFAPGAALNSTKELLDYIQVHKWKLNDLVMWDNRQTMHRGRRYDETQARDVRRTTVAGDAPTVAQAAE
jgi:alpha-ketoglutarate-dependent 2,4-dichlorophenoxyacetate dioxygenase